MAYAVLFSLSQTITEILKPGEFPVSDIGKQQIESLQEQVLSLHEFVGKYGNEGLSLESRISTAANEAEDILEHFMYEHIRWHHKMVRTAAVRQTAEEPATYLYDFGDLRFAMEEFKSIAQEAEGIKKNIDKKDKESESSTTPSSNQPLINNVTVGQEEDLEKIKGLLCDPSVDLKIIPITGMGGIGKTTLARNAYNDETVKKGFTIHAWITVSHNFKLQKIFEDLLEMLKNVDLCTYESNADPQDKVYRILGDRKYLIVLDDLWSTEAWYKMKPYFPQRKNGSRVVITTREKDVGDRARDTTTPLHEMKLLNEALSFSLLEKRVFGDNKCPGELNDIGQGIATSCGGLPLAIVLIAGILSHVESTRVSWDEIAKDVHSALKKEKNSEEILGEKISFEERITLSYTYLPRHLRQGFLYMGGFPEDHQINVSKLMRLWVAEGFIKPRDHNQSVEDAADKYLEDLIRRNLALATTMKSNGKIKSCNVHDMVRDMCKERSLDENYERRLSINNPDLTRLARAYGSTLRSIITFQPSDSSLGGLRKFKLLRLLDVVDTEAYSLPAPVFELFHLRYLAFGCPMELPPAVCRLQNLRTLVIRQSKRFRTYSMDEIYLPIEIWSLPMLRDLFSFFDLLPSPPATASPLVKLLTLSVVKKLICTKELMRMIPNLKKLGITYFGDKYKEDYQLKNLELLEHLEKLKLVMKAESFVELKINPVYPKTLRKLTLSGWRCPWEDLNVVGDLPILQVLKLRDHACEGDEWKTQKGQFPRLKYLLIDTSDLKKWDTEKSHFPALERLMIYGCSLLDEFPDGVVDITTLELIVVDRANDRLVEHVEQIYEGKKADGDNSTLQLEVVHYKVSQFS